MPGGQEVGGQKKFLSCRYVHFPGCPYTILCIFCMFWGVLFPLCVPPRFASTAPRNVVGPERKRSLMPNSALSAVITCPILRSAASLSALWLALAWCRIGYSWVGGLNRNHGDHPHSIWDVLPPCERRCGIKIRRSR